MNIFVKAYVNNQLLEFFNVNDIKSALYYVNLSHKCGANRVTVCKRAGTVSLDELKQNIKCIDKHSWKC